MNAFQSVSHFASFALSVYVMYAVVATLGFGAFVWKRVYADGSRLQRVQVQQRRITGQDLRGR